MMNSFAIVMVFFATFTSATFENRFSRQVAPVNLRKPPSAVEPFVAIPLADGSFKKVDEIAIDVPMGPPGCKPGENCEALTVYGEEAPPPPPPKRIRLRGNITPKKIRQSAEEFRNYAEALEKTAEIVEDATQQGNLVEFQPMKVLKAVTEFVRSS
eukprot:Platyproteum_vivax@DN4241_c0_g1_i1.p1